MLRLSINAAPVAKLTRSEGRVSRGRQEEARQQRLEKCRQSSQPAPHLRAPRLRAAIGLAPWSGTLALLFAHCCTNPILLAHKMEIQYKAKVLQENRISTVICKS